METFLNYGNGIITDFGPMWRYGDFTAFHMHPHYELLIMAEPLKIRLISCGKQIQIDYPCAILTAPYIPHYVNPLEANGVYDRFVFYFDAEVANAFQLSFPIDELLNNSNSASRIFNLTDDIQFLLHILRAIERTKSYDDQKKLLEVILNNFYQHKSATDIAKKTDSYILEVINYILHNMESAGNAQELADRFFVSYNKLRRDFKNYTYMSIGEFILTVKLNRAKEFLKMKEIPIAEIVKKCGWESESYFYKMFRARTGKTPLQYRKNNIIR